MTPKETINKKELIEWIREEGVKIYEELGHDRIDPYRKGIIDGYKKVIKKLKGEI